MKKSHNQLNDFPKEQVRSAIQAGIIQAEKQGHSKKTSVIKSRKRKILYILSSVAAVFGILVGSSYHSTVLASSLSQIPIIGSVFADSNLVGLKQAQKNGLTSKVGETQTGNGISVKLDEILYDQNDIVIDLKIESEKELGEFYFRSGMDFTINGEYPNGASSGYEENIESSTTRTVVQDISVSEEMPNDFELGIILTGENGEKFYFSTPIKQIADIIHVPIQHKENVDDIELAVTELTISETSIGISYESTEKGTDLQLSRGRYIDFIVVDQDGNEITSHSGSATVKKLKNSMLSNSNKKFDSIDLGVKELTITPYLDLPADGGGVEFDENGESRELEFKGDSLQPVEFKSFKVKIPK